MTITSIASSLEQGLSKPPARIAMLSAREVRHHVSDAMIYEFEDAISSFDDVDLYTYDVSPDWSRRIYSVSQKILRSHRLAQVVTPKMGQVQHLKQDYELFVVILRNIFEVAALGNLDNWKQRSRKTICILMEALDSPNWLEQRKSLFNWLKSFDHIFLCDEHAIPAIQGLTGVPCTYSPLAVDTLSFCPYNAHGLEFRSRSIDVAALGRRSEITHKQLLNLARTGSIFYYYDTVFNPYFSNYSEHRFQYAALLRASRFFVANYGKIDEFKNQPDHRQEISGRFYEGAAAGSVMIGTAPNTKTFRELFDWVDVVIPMAFDEPNIVDFLAELQSDPLRLEMIQRRNVIQALRRHDWSYRWKSILQTIELSLPAQLVSYIAHLNDVADCIEGVSHRKASGGDR